MPYEDTIGGLQKVIDAKFDLVFVQLEGLKQDLNTVRDALKACRAKSDIAIDTLSHDVIQLRSDASFDRGAKSAKREWHSIIWAAMTALATAGAVIMAIVAYSGHHK